jgi:hypothetical protein
MLSVDEHLGQSLMVLPGVKVIPEYTWLGFILVALGKEPWFVGEITSRAPNCGAVIDVGCQPQPGTQHGDLSGLLQVCGLDEAYEFTVSDK